MKPLTEKQQARARAKIFKLLVAIGFQLDEKGGYYWRRVTDHNDAPRVCVGFAVFDKLFQRRGDCWMWQIAKLTEEPAFGYSGSVSTGAAFGTVERVIGTTLEQFWSAGISHSAAYNQAKVAKAKEKIAAMLTLVRDEL